MTLSSHKAPYLINREGSLTAAWFYAETIKPRSFHLQSSDSLTPATGNRICTGASEEIV